MSWATPEQAAAWWPESKTLDPATVQALLDASTHRLGPYAVPLPDPDPGEGLADALTARAMANVYDARDLRAAALSDAVTVDQLLSGDYTVTRRGPSQQVRQLLRPTRPAVAR